MKNMMAKVFYLASFGLARGALFLAPIVLANLLSPTDYGNIELAQAIASVVAPLLALGTSGLIPLVLIQKVDSASWGSVLTHHAVVCSLLGILGVLGVQLGWSPVNLLSVLITGAFMLQALWSVTLKSLGRSEASLFLDSGFWSILTISAVVSYLFSVPANFRLHWLIGSLVIYYLVVLVWTFWRLCLVRGNIFFRSYFSTIRTGLPLMAASLLALLATTSGRLGLGLLSTPELLADYAVLFRATALPIVVHQIIVVAQFRKIFELSKVDLERKISVIVGLVMLGTVFFWLISGYVGSLLGSAFSLVFAKNRAEGLLILFQCILWSAIALNDLVNSRFKTAGPVVRATVVYFVLVLPMAWLFLSGRVVALSIFVPVHSLVMAGYYATQAFVMWRHGVNLSRTWILTLAGFAVLSFFALMA